tara:strand:+ start:45 stop:800 length:756 start_codon:yes stop_codon:yes gene_type:complete
MRILLVDNTKNNKCDFTRILEKKLLFFTKDVTVCDDIEKINDITNQMFDAIILSGSSLNLSQPNKIEYINKSVNILLRYSDTPILGICFGMQLILASYGSNIKRLETPQNKECMINVDKNSILFGGLPVKSNVTLSHQDYASCAPDDFNVYSRYNGCIQVAESLKFKRFGVQFHPEKKVENEPVCVLSNFFIFLKEIKTIPYNISLIKYYTLVFDVKNTKRVKNNEFEKNFIMLLWNNHRHIWNIPSLLVC